MTRLDIKVGRKDFRTAQEVLPRICLEGGILISQNRHSVVYRIHVEESQIASVIQKLRKNIKSLSLCAVAKEEYDILPRKVNAGQPKVCAFRAMNLPVKEGELIMRRMFGFKTLDEQNG